MRACLLSRLASTPPLSRALRSPPYPRRAHTPTTHDTTLTQLPALLTACALTFLGGASGVPLSVLSVDFSCRALCTTFFLAMKRRSGGRGVL